MGADIRDKVLVAVLTAAALGGLTLLWNWASQGGVVRAMGGLTASDLAYLQQPHLNGVPTGAVAAFDLPNGCPEGWSAFKDAQSRAIIGADFGQGFAPGLGANGDGSALRTWKYRDHGGGAAAEGGAGAPPFIALYYCKKD